MTFPPVMEFLSRPRTPLWPTADAESVVLIPHRPQPFERGNALVALRLCKKRLDRAPDELRLRDPEFAGTFGQCLVEVLFEVELFAHHTTHSTHPALPKAYRNLSA